MSAQLEAAMPAFTHEALMYGSDRDYLEGTVPFIEEGLDAGEPVLVAVPTRKVELLRNRFDSSADQLLRIVSMEEMGRNPAWIIPAWADFVAPHLAAGRTARGIGEPIWAERSAEELVECTRHESLINLAFAAADGFTLLCPYDTASLQEPVLEGALHNHPHIVSGGTMAHSERYRAEFPALLDVPLPAVPAHATIIGFSANALAPVRHLAAELATDAGLSPQRIDDLLVAISEGITNSIRHGGGRGEIAFWTEPDRFLCEVRDAGRITDPLAGRVRPQVDEPGGRGLWLMNQICDLVQVRSVPDGQVVRLHLIR